MSLSSLSSMALVTATLVATFSLLPMRESMATEIAGVKFRAPHPVQEACFQKIVGALPALTHQTGSVDLFRGRTKLRHAVPTHNDMMCTDPEWMMNAVVTVEDTRTKESWYGIFHVHVTPDGMLKSPSSHETSPWIKYKHPREWQVKWCDFINGLYPEDYKAQCTPNNN